ncbi:hypothetical protein [Bacillus sp. TH13]|uniref:hypothetical protein n=1 Tax=Bacillus sp. TH13 TaxID=2796379 RepID=UPI00191254D9|nr:hypothetical protein [Bacillus sp. TH13]MBK5492578.1 hypothetical protein [Bacillus sp. TH13]
MKTLNLKFHTNSGEPVVVKNISGYKSFMDFMNTNGHFKWVIFNDVALPMDKVVKVEELKL